MRAVDQFLATFSRRDAIGEHALQIRSALAEIGVEGGIYARTLNPGTKRLGGHLSDWRPDPARLALYHVSIGSPIAERLLAEAPRLALDYHNITPRRFFEAWEPAVAAELGAGRRQLVELAEAAEFGIADSAYNAAELTDAGCSPTSVVPIIIDFDNRPEPDPRHVERLRDTHPGPHWLFVGRIAPNKAQHDLICALAHYRRHIDPTAHLTLIGATSSARYHDTLQRLTHQLGCTDAVTFTGSVDDTTLAAYYRAADIFVCLSDHEGFCVPLLEAMHHQIPIIAHAAAAIPETLGDAGLLLTDKRPLTVATTCAHLHHDPHLARTLTTRATQHLQHYNPTTTRQRLLDTLTPHLQ